MSWLALNGYGIYVWPAYGATFLILSVIGIKAYLKYKKNLSALVKI